MSRLIVVATILIGVAGHAAAADAGRGARLFTRDGCGACHALRALGAHGLVGPPLDNMGARTVIAGLLPNNPENMERWLREPQSIVPGDAMPNVGLSQRDAADIAAYLEELK
ncbi:MAG TPA: cytochrome c [Stellaceae bacterium]|nr:cytochrome c [Stellaceae bacterium]